MTYRTKTYIAADWDGDKDAIDQLRKWNESNYWALSFVDAHEMTQARDSSLNCSIKSSLKARLDSSKTFVLIVGDHTNNLTAGSCQYCGSYNRVTHFCARIRHVDYKSFIQYECDVAVGSPMKIIVLYKSLIADKKKCPEALRDIGLHIPMLIKRGEHYYWNYEEVKKAFE